MTYRDPNSPKDADYWREKWERQIEHNKLLDGSLRQARERLAQVQRGVENALELKAESEGRLRALSAKTEEARTEWQRAERAESRVATLEAAVSHAIEAIDLHGSDGTAMAVRVLSAALAAPTWKERQQDPEHQALVAEEMKRLESQPVESYFGPLDYSNTPLFTSVAWHKQHDAEIRAEARREALDAARRAVIGLNRPHWEEFDDAIVRLINRPETQIPPPGVPDPEGKS